VVTVSVREPHGRPRYRAEVLPDTPKASRLTGLPALPAELDDEFAGYHNGALFHGPALRGIRAVLADDGTRMVLACRLPATDIGGLSYGTADYRPAHADLLLQAALVRVHVDTGNNSLPTSVDEVDVHAPLPADQPFLLVVDQVTHAGSTTRCTVTACTPDGVVLLRFGGVEVVSSAGLGAKFAQH
jgi:hypothetical protein